MNNTNKMFKNITINQILEHWIPGSHLPVMKANKNDVYDREYYPIYKFEDVKNNKLIVYYLHDLSFDPDYIMLEITFDENDQVFLHKFTSYGMNFEVLSEQTRRYKPNGEAFVRLER